MKKLKFSNGRPAKFGDSGIAVNDLQVVEFVVTPRTVEKLIAMGILEWDTPEEMTESKKLGIDIKSRMNSVSMDIAFYHNVLVGKLCKEGNMTTTTAFKALDAIKVVNKVSYFALLLKEVAIELDKSYENHISSSSTLFTISAKDGKPYAVNPETLKTTNTVALFRTKVDAIIACKILASLKKEVFSGRRK